MSDLSDDWIDSVIDVAAPGKPRLRVVEHPNVLAGFCLLTAPDGELLYVGPLKQCRSHFRDGASWFLGSLDFTRLAEFYERNYQDKVPTHQVPETLQ